MILKLKRQPPVAADLSADVRKYLIINTLRLSADKFAATGGCKNLKYLWSIAHDTIGYRLRLQVDVCLEKVNLSVF
jgi:hypothetical protein